ncbi:34656_t:CDS:2, partial [Gigaspora margarita]
FLETNNLSEEAMGYSKFTTFTKEKFGQDESKSLNTKKNIKRKINISSSKYDTRTNQKTNCDNSDSNELFDNGFEINVIDL